MAMDAGICRVTLEFAKDLKDADWFSKNDAYAKVKCGSQQYRTKTLKNAGTSPVWNETFSFNIINENSVEVEVYDADTTRDDHLGTAVISLARVRTSGVDKIQAPVVRPSNKQKGFVSVTLVYESNSKLQTHGHGHAHGYQPGSFAGPPSAHYGAPPPQYAHQPSMYGAPPPGYHPQPSIYHAPPPGGGYPGYPAPGGAYPGYPQPAPAPYGAPPGGAPYGAPPAQYGAPVPYGAPPAQYGAPAPYGAPPAQYGAPAPYGAPPAQYGAPAPHGAPPLHGAPAPYGAPQYGAPQGGQSYPPQAGYPPR